MRCRAQTAAMNGTKKLTPYLVRTLASQFFVRGSVHRSNYGSAPLVQFNEHRFQDGDYDGPQWLKEDVALISEKGRIGLFHYGPRMWMRGSIEPLEALQDPARRGSVIDRILKEYPERILPKGEFIYRLRVNPEDPIANGEYDSPPDAFLGRGRLDSLVQPVLYCSQDIESCVHECRVTVEDDLYLAALTPLRDLKLLDLTVLLNEEHESEFKSLDIAVHMLFLCCRPLLCDYTGYRGSSPQRGVRRSSLPLVFQPSALGGHAVRGPLTGYPSAGSRTQPSTLRRASFRTSPCSDDP